MGLELGVNCPLRRVLVPEGFRVSRSRESGPRACPRLRRSRVQDSNLQDSNLKLPAILPATRGSLAFLESARRRLPRAIVAPRMSCANTEGSTFESWLELGTP